MPTESPFQQLGEERVRELARRLYEAMEADEPELAGLHEQTPEGAIEAGVRERFALFLIGWLGGPQTYIEQHGHPRLRMRHARVPVNTAMRDAWLRAMNKALDGVGVTGTLRAQLDTRFAELADFLRNVPG